MKTLLASWICAGLLLAAARAADSDYVPGPDSRPQPGVPKGELLQYTFDHSKLYPGTTRSYWIYVPAQYRPDTPACLFVGQDGVQWNANVVFDNLIARREMPVTIGVFVQPGVVKGSGPVRASPFATTGASSTTSLGDTYVRFLSLPSSCRKSRPGEPRTADPSASRPTRWRPRDRRARAAGPFARSPRPGSGPIRSNACSARSAPTSGCAAATSIRR